MLFFSQVCTFVDKAKQIVGCLALEDLFGSLDCQVDDVQLPGILSKHSQAGAQGNHLRIISNVAASKHEGPSWGNQEHHRSRKTLGNRAKIVDCLLPMSNLKQATSSVPLPTISGGQGPYLRPCCVTTHPPLIHFPWHLGLGIHLQSHRKPTIDVRSHHPLWELRPRLGFQGTSGCHLRRAWLVSRDWELAPNPTWLPPLPRNLVEDSRKFIWALSKTFKCLVWW